MRKLCVTVGLVVVFGFAISTAAETNFCGDGHTYRFAISRSIIQDTLLYIHTTNNLHIFTETYNVSVNVWQNVDSKLNSGVFVVVTGPFRGCGDNTLTDPAKIEIYTVNALVAKEWREKLRKASDTLILLEKSPELAAKPR